MSTSTQEQEYGLGIDAIGIGLSLMKAVTSVKGDGKTFLNGKMSMAGNPPGAFTKLGRLTPGVSGDIVVSVDEGTYPLFGDKVVEGMTSLGWRHVHSQHSGRKLLFSFYRTELPTTLYRLIGTTFPDGEEGSQGKAGNKRDRVFGALDSPDAGAFVCRTPSVWEGDVCQIILPYGESLKVLAVAAPHDANDGDAIVKLSAAEALADAAEISRREWDLLDHIQFQIRTQGKFLKAMGQVPAEWPEEWSDYDIVIGAPGVSSATSTDHTVGKITFHYAPRRDLGFRVADGLESVPNVLLKYYQARDLVQYGQLVAIRKLMEDQYRILSANPKQVADADYFDEESAAARKQRLKEKAEAQVRNVTNEEERQFAQLVRDWTGSVYGHATTLGNANLSANLVRGILKKAATKSDESEGMPYAVLPGHYLNRAWHRFGGVPEPEYGTSTIVFRPDGSPYFFVLNDAQVGNPDVQLRDSTPDNDDHWLSTIGRDGETGEFYLVAARQPNEPDGGQHYKVTPEQAEQWAKTRPIMPLRKGWGHRVPSLVDLDNQFRLTELTETQPPTHDLAEITAYCRWAIGEGRNVAEYANATQSLFNSGASVAETYSCSSDLLDNIWLQKYRGQQIVEQVMAKAVSYIAEGRPWHQPTYARIRRRVEDLYRKENNGKDPNIRFGSYPDLERLYTGVRDLDDMLDFEASVLKGFCNGPYPMLTRPVDEGVAAIAAQTVVAVKKEWASWGKEKNRIMRNYRLPFARREDLVAKATDRTMSRIRDRVLADYEKAREGETYVGGQYAAALAQAQTAHAPRWERPDGRYRVTKARRHLPRPAYQLLQHIPERELRHCYEYNQQIAEENNGTGPTWVCRIRMLGDNPTPYQGEWGTVVKGDDGRYRLVADTTGEVLAYMEREAVGIDGLTVQFVGAVPRYSSVEDPEFYQDFELAVFSCRHKEVLDRVNTKRHAAKDAVAAKCQLNV